MPPPAQVSAPTAFALDAPLIVDESVSGPKPVELSVIVPTFNESGNVDVLVHRLGVALKDFVWEVIFVDDDSPDGTAARVRAIAQKDPRVRCLQRIGRRGLSRAVIEGVLASSAPYFAVVDGDLQHDEEVLPRMLERLRDDALDIVVGSRYVSGGSLGDWDQSRARVSRIATVLSRSVIKADLSDPMSGFFVMRREAFDSAVRRLSGEGYKILLDLFASSPTALRFSEVPYTFRKRLVGESKLDSAVVWQYLLLLADKKFGRYVPARFMLFSLVGTSGLVMHFAVLTALHAMLALSFGLSQALATVAAMTSNFALNNSLTYRDRRLRGSRLWLGLASFYLVCGIGAVANVGVANALFERDYTWVLAGAAGVLVGIVWNYVSSSVFTWGRR